MEYITFIVFTKDNGRITVSTKYDETKEHEIDAAWDYIRELYPHAEYIEKF